MLLLTLCRKGELVAAKWQLVDLDRGESTVPPANQKSNVLHLVPLSRHAVELLRELKGLSGSSPYVLTSLQGRRDKPLAESTLNWGLWQITRMRGTEAALLDVPHFTLHDFPRTVSTPLNEHGYASDWIEKSLGHTIRGIRGIDNRTAYADDRGLMLQYWANFLDGLADGTVAQLRAGKVPMNV